MLPRAPFCGTTAGFICGTTVGFICRPDFGSIGFRRASSDAAFARYATHTLVASGPQAEKCFARRPTLGFSEHVHIEKIDPARDEADFAAIVACVQQDCRDYFGEFPVIGSHRMRFWFAASFERDTATFGAFTDKPDREFLGYASLGLSKLENLDEAGCAIQALPDVPGAGVTGAEVTQRLVDHVRGYTREQGRSKVIIGMSDAASAERYAPIRAGRLVYSAQRSVLDLRAVRRDRREQFAAWAAPGPKNEQYRLVRWEGHCPDELAEAFPIAMAAMEDAPLEDLVHEHPALDPDRIRRHDDHVLEYGVRRHVTAAVTADGAIGGFTMFAAYPQEPGALDIWDTGVPADHRGHGLGLRLKADATLWMLREYPDADWTHTFNSHVNEHMLAVNWKLGYQPADLEQEFEFEA